MTKYSCCEPETDSCNEHTLTAEEKLEKIAALPCLCDRLNKPSQYQINAIVKVLESHFDVGVTRTNMKEVAEELWQRFNGNIPCVMNGSYVEEILTGKKDAYYGLESMVGMK